MKKIIIISLAFFLLIFCSVGVTFNFIYSNKLDYLSRVWKHRGGNPENSILGVKKSYEEGMKGFELDIFYKDGRFVLSHDKPENINNANDLENLLKEMANEKFNLWLDFKNLSSTPMGTSRELANLLKKYSMLDKTIVESKSGFCLASLKLNHIRTSYWVVLSGNSIFSIFKKLYYRLMILVFNYEAISFDKSFDLIEIKNISQRINLHVFTLNSLDDQNSYLNDSQIKVILTK